MDIFKKKSLCAALAGIGALGAAGAAQAVNLNPDGLGQVLIYPYYTTRADANGNVYNSLLSVVNTTTSVKAVKVRFLESLNSREVLDFNVFLSPKDVWTAGVVPDDTTGGAKVITADRSCTLPAIPAGGQSFVNFAYATGDAADGGDPSYGRTKEGYVEIIEMATYALDSETAAAVTHDPPGTGSPPGPCDASLDAVAETEALAPGGGLMGGITLINVNAGSDYTEDAVALDGFSDSQLYTTPNSVTPNLSDASPPISVVFNNNTVYTSTWLAGEDAVSAVLMHEHVYNEYVLDAGTLSGTDWVLTMPTKRYYVAPGTGSAIKLFQRNFEGTQGSCDDVALTIFDREEGGGGGSGGNIDFSPIPPGAPPSALCFEANVVTFNGSNVLGSANSKNLITENQNGWLDLSFVPPSVVAAPGVHTLFNSVFLDGGTIVQPLQNLPFGPVDATYVGLPVIGFAVQSFTNGAVMVNGAPTLSNYGGNFVNKGTRRINIPLIP